MQVEPLKHVLKAPGTTHLKLKYDNLPSSSALKFNLRRYSKAPYVESVNVGMGGKGAGLASTVHFVSGLLTEGYVKGKPMVYGGRLNYATSSHCAEQGLSGDFECYTKPFSGCIAAKQSAFAKWRAPYQRNNRRGVTLVHVSA